MAKVVTTAQLKVTGRPRIDVDYALVLHLREDRCLGWTRMAEEYRRIKGEFVSRETMKRRYLEAKLRKSPV